MSMPRIALLMTGNELIHGDLIDTNGPLIANQLKDIGLFVSAKITLGDDLTALTSEIERLSHNYDLVIMNGGLGPTQDDLTAPALANAFSQQLTTHPEAKAHIEQWCQKKNIQVNQKQLKQAELPEKATLFDGAPGSAAAFWVKHKKSLFIATPGVPSELKYILQHQLIAFIKHKFSAPDTQPWQTATLFGLSESSIERLIEQSSIKAEQLDIGFRVNTPYIEFKYQLNDTLSATEKKTVQKYVEDIIAPYFVGDKQTNMAQALSLQLRAKNQCLSTAESCTGGLIAHLMTQQPGASQVFEGAAVTYSNALKEKMIHVPAETLKKYGAVSEPTAIAMLKGLLDVTKTDYGIAVTGIAGPDGATEGKPVGTVFIAFGSATENNVIQLLVPAPRQLFQSLVAICALDLVRHLIKSKRLPSYIHRWQVAE